MKSKELIPYVCAVLLIASSIALAFIQVLQISTVANGTLMYIAQAFLLAGSIFGLDYYVHRITKFVRSKTSKGSSEQ